jgi:hypothetical protein
LLPLSLAVAAAFFGPVFSVPRISPMGTDEKPRASIRAIPGSNHADGLASFRPVSSSLWPVSRPCHHIAHPAQNTCGEYKPCASIIRRKLNRYISLQLDKHTSTLAYTSVSWFVGQTAANTIARDEPPSSAVSAAFRSKPLPLAPLTRLPNCQRPTSDAQRRSCLTAILAAHRRVSAIAATSVPNVNKISFDWRRH